jgi:hypothetical protein
MKTPKLSDIGKNITPKTNEILDYNIDDARKHHRNSLEDRRLEIIKKIENLENKLQKHIFKEGMLDKIINGTYAELENLKEHEFTKRGQKQSILIKQLEALSILHDTILKYEDMIQKYHKILIDLENNKFNSYLKVEGLKKEEEKTDQDLSELLMILQEQMKSNSSNSSINPLVDDIKKELLENGY